MYWERDEQAIAQTKMKYGAMLRALAYHILHNREDSEECENDTYLGAWNAIPPARPGNLSAFLSKTVRNIAISRRRANYADKRGGGEAAVPLHELDECIPDVGTDAWQAGELAQTLNDFLDTLPTKERLVFVCRYWRCDSVADIAARFGYSQGKVKMMLMRTRGKLRAVLEKEGLMHEAK
jgi:RNA polymerase sigma-70 factor (ECF subfamily)